MQGDFGLSFDYVDFLQASEEQVDCFGGYVPSLFNRIELIINLHQQVMTCTFW